jgi:hypothetical protein
MPFLSRILVPLLWTGRVALATGEAARAAKEAR